MVADGLLWPYNPMPRSCGMLSVAFRQTLAADSQRAHAMKAETWLARCAAELHHLHLTRPRCSEEHAPPDEWGNDTAGELMEADRYRGLDPVQAARVFWRDQD
jgi:hypothetical protein